MLLTAIGDKEGTVLLTNRSLKEPRFFVSRTHMCLFTPQKNPYKINKGCLLSLIAVSHFPSLVKYTFLTMSGNVAEYSDYGDKFYDYFSHY